MKDTFKREINYLRISVTDRCNLRCKYCMPETGIAKKPHDSILRHEEIIEIAKSASYLGIKKVRLTGGEPLVRNGIENLIEEISEIQGIDEITMTTNGILLKDKLLTLKEAGLSRINLSLDTLKPERYHEITRGGSIQNVLEVIPEIIKLGMVPLKINVVLIKGVNDDEIEDFVELTRHQPIDVRFIELMPIGEASNFSKGKFISNQTVLERVHLIKSDTVKGSPAVYYKLENGVGRIGLINPISCNFCDECNRIRITSDGKVKPCLHSNHEIDLIKALRNHEDITEVLKKSIADKPEKHLINEEDFVPIDRNMNRIGG